MNNNKNYTCLGLIFLVVITSITTFLLSGLGSLFLTGGLGGISIEDAVFVRKILASKKLLESEYYENITEQDLMDGAMSGMFDALDDPYTSYLPKETNQQLMELTDGKYEGIGVYVSVNAVDNTVTVLSPLKDSPADRAGILPLDKIISINGVECAGDNLDKAVELMKCPAGETINLVLERDGERLERTVVTEEIVLESVESENYDGIGYIEIATFSDTTSEEFFKHYDALRDENITGLILDLRDNGGGIYDEALAIAKKLVPKGLIVYTEDKNGQREEEYSVSDGIDIPIVVLVNEESASASEILAGALKDREIATLVGKKTFGKGLVQGWYSIGDGTSVKLTIAKYFTPSGVCIDGVGIEPDYEVELGSYSNDLQLKKALELLKK